MGSGADSPCQGELARRARGGREGEHEHEVLIEAVPGGVLPNPSLLPANPSEAGSPGRGGARERTQFSPPGGNGVEWTLRRRAAVGKVTKTPLGDAADGHFVPIGPLTPSPPLRGTRTCKIEENSRCAKSEWPSKFLPPHWGLAKRKIKACAISVLHLALPSSRLLSLGVGAAHRAARFRYEIRPIARRGRCPHRPVAGCATGETGSLLSVLWGRFPPLSFIDTPAPAALPGGRAARW